MLDAQFIQGTQERVFRVKHGLLASQSRREETRNSRCEFILCLVGVFGHVRRRVHGWCMDEVGNDSLMLALVLA